MSFSDEHDLRDWLHRHGIDTSTWGTGVAKSLRDLWSEYLSAESAFDDALPGRLVFVVCVVIRRGDQVLIEAGQTMANGVRRARNALPMEKMKSGESVRDAALRCVREELGVAVADSPRHTTPPPVVDVHESVSYPGLLTRYTSYEYELAVDNLPDGAFTTQEAGDAVAIHSWEWRNADEAPRPAL